ncbi:MAG: ATP-dependent DNA helicase PcrA [Syntrophorhabdus sp. PtaU1.Bin002]|nr:MAG: ATP-dependent DNA helicase PcrA [Syntrophorhabdus sp. PtaU1.Bin002]
MSIKYSPLQRKIVETTEGAMAVIASAGSGKTRVLTGRIDHVLSTKPGSYKMLALTFTNKAADEMKSRLASLPDVSERVFIGTIHSLCLNIIRGKGHIIGYDEMPHIFNNENDRMEIVTEVLSRNKLLSDSYNSKSSQDQKKLVYEALDYISSRKRNLEYSETDDEEELQLLYDDYNLLLSEQNAIDYDDIIVLAVRIFSERPKVAELYRKVYKYICVDEAQDLNLAQYEFVKSLCGQEHRNVLMVGDGKQAIFGFNGSDKKYFTEYFIHDFGARQIVLTENYRNSKAVLRIANAVYPGSNDETAAAMPGRAEFYSAKNEEDEARYVYRKMEEYTTELKRHDEIEGEITYDNICIIARNKYIFKEIEALLSRHKKPYYYKRGSDTVLFETDKLKVFELGLRVVLNPSDKLHVKQVRQMLKLSLEASLLTFESLKMKIADLNDPVLCSVLSAWKVISENSANYRNALDIIQESLRNSSLENEEKLALHNELESAKEYWKKYCSSVSKDSVSTQGFLNNIALGMVNLSSMKEKGVTLATVHSVKGLEYDIVFIIGLNEGSFPDYRAIKAGDKSLNEEKNETNVAITRAKRFLHLSYPKTKFMPWDKETPYSQKVSRFLRPIWDVR